MLFVWFLVVATAAASLAAAQEKVADFDEPVRYYAYRYDQKDLNGCTSMDAVLPLENRLKLKNALFAPCQNYWQATRMRSLIFKHNILPKHAAHFATKKKACDVTLMTPTSLARLATLAEIAESWSGPIALSFYGGDADAELMKVFVLKTPSLANRTNIMFNHVRRVEKDFDYKKNENIYPVNLLRNDAIRSVVSPFVFAIDIDTVPRKGLYERLVRTHLPAMYGGAKCPFAFDAGEKHRKALVVPAFTQDVLSSQEVPLDKAALVKEWSATNLFAGSPPISYPQSQSPTEYGKWRAANAAYDVQWEAGYEPFIVVPKKDYPQYEKLLFWLFDDKPSNILELRLLNYTFTVLPDEYIVHLHRTQDERELQKWEGMCQLLMQSIFFNKLSNRYGAAGRELLGTTYAYCFSVEQAGDACMCGA